MKYFSMFTGIGGFELGIERAHEKQKTVRKGVQTRRDSTNAPSPEGRDVKAECVGYSEINKFAIQVFEKRFPGIKNYGDATKIDADNLPDFDMLCGGFPCQAFSIAGKRRGFKDTRGTLFFDIARILKAKRPKTVFLENVKGLLNHEQGNTFRVIIQTLSELGYDVQWMVLNSKFFGVPQNRERVFIIGNLRGTSRQEILPFKESAEEADEEHKETRQIIQVDDVARENKHKLGDRLKEDGATFTLNSIEQRGIIQLNKPKHSNERLYSPKGLSPSLNTMQGGQRQPFIQLKLCPTITCELSHQYGRLFTPEKFLEITGEMRRLTPTECERLQGFPDGWTLIKQDNGKDMSDTQRYKMLGNAVTVNVIEAIARRMK